MAQRVRQLVVVVDASVLFALADADDVAHESCVATLEDLGGATLVVSPFALAEADYLVTERLGGDAELALLADVARNAYRIVPFDKDDVGACFPIVNRYREHAIGLADASTVLLAHRWRTRRIFTLDRRHFEVMRPLSGGRFELLPG